MADELFLLLLMVGAVVLLFWGISRQQNQIEATKEQLRKLAQQAGGRDIVIWREHGWGKNGYVQFVLLYVDANGVRQKHRIAKHLDGWGALRDDLFWDKPLQLPNIAPLISTSSSKEQIISEMDAEIKRLQEELKRTREES